MLVSPNNNIFSKDKNKILLDKIDIHKNKYQFTLKILCSNIIILLYLISKYFSIKDMNSFYFLD